MALLAEMQSHGLGDRVAVSRWRMSVKTAVHFTRLTETFLAERAERILKERPFKLTDRHVLALETLVRDVREPLDEFGRPRRRE